MKKQTLIHGLSCEICKNFSEHIFYRAPLNDPLYFATVAGFIYSCQFSSSEKSLVGKRIHPYISSRILEIYISFIFIFLRNTCLLSRFCQVYTLLWAANHLKQLNTMLLTNFKKLKFHFEHFLRKTQTQWLFVPIKEPPIYIAVTRGTSIISPQNI